MSALIDALVTARVRLDEETAAIAKLESMGFGTGFDAETARRERARFAALVALLEARQREGERS